MKPHRSHLVAAHAVFSFLLALAFLCLPGAYADGTGAAAEETIPVPESMSIRNIPPIPEAATADLLPFENLRSASFQDWHPTERSILITTRFAETSQLHEVTMPLGARKQLTFYDERVFGGSYRPGNGAQLIFSLDEGGAENYQLFLLDRAARKTTRLSDGEHRYGSALWSRNGTRLAYNSNARNGRDFDIYVANPDQPGTEKLVVEASGTWYPLDFSADGAHLLVGEWISANESRLYSVDLGTGEVSRLTPSGEDEKAAWRGGEFTPDGRFVYTTTDAGGEFLQLVRLDTADGSWKALTQEIPWDIEGFDLSEDGKLLAVVSNEDGISRLHLLDTASDELRAVRELPDGIIRGGAFRPGNHEFAVVLNSARSPSDVYSFDPANGKLERWTESEVGGLDPGTFTLPELVRFPTFDEVEPGRRRTIPAFVYRPDPERHPGPRPVYIDIHGGPEGQTRPRFLGTTNYLLDELGIAVIYPNVRGSSGYGKRYLMLDDAARREDSVRDIGALLDWIATQPDLNAGRVMVGGGSYGGYMVLASMVHFGDRLRAGFDYVGISNFVTFLENTQEYRRDRRRVEYGDERDPEMRKVLTEISPATHADRIRRPMLVAQGANDPRVPLSESDQIVARLADAGVPAWYMVAADEGHGFRKKTNADYLRAVWVEFIRRFLVEAPAVPPAGSEAPANR